MHPLCLAVWYGLILCLSGIGCATSSIECSFNHGITTWRVAWYASADLVLVLTCAAGQQWGWVRSPLHHPSPQFFMWTCSVGCWSLTWAKNCSVYISDISVEIWPIPKSYFAANRERRPDMAFGVWFSSIQAAWGYKWIMKIPLGRWASNWMRIPVCFSGLWFFNPAYDCMCIYTQVD
jgi:hypothetical protein